MPRPRVLALAWVMSRPSSAMRPLLTVTKPATICSVVVLPQPDGPSRETNSPFSTARFIADTAQVLPKNLLKSVSCRKDIHGPLEMDVCEPREGADQPDGRAGRFDPQGAIACIRVVHRTDGPGASDSIYCKQRARPHRVFHYRSPYVLITVWIDDIDNPRDPGAHRSRGFSRPFKKHGVAPCRCRAANVCAKERGADTG